jgi:hypothetical protein
VGWLAGPIGGLWSGKSPPSIFFCFAFLFFYYISVWISLIEFQFCLQILNLGLLKK